MYKQLTSQQRSQIFALLQKEVKKKEIAHIIGCSVSTVYYSLIQAIRDKGTDNAEEWEAWILFMLKGVEETEDETIRLVKAIDTLMGKYKKELRPLFGRQYKHELINNLFSHPYTKIEYIERDMQVTRNTALKYLQQIVDAGLLHKEKVGLHNYYINTQLVEVVLNVSEQDEQK